MERGVDVWIRDAESLWLPATIIEKVKLTDNSYNIVVQVTDTETKVFRISDGDEDPNDIKLRNSSESNDIDDLTGLQHLHEPAILYSLEERYKKGIIYTFTGPILIAINPFKDMKDLYSNENLELYLAYEKLNSSDNELKPHAYSIAGAAYGRMMAAIGLLGDTSRPRDQSILISGESGAGKTESTKIVLGYLTRVSSRREYINVSAAFEPSSIMNKILSTNPILESFGNAKTNRNKNSSRFGKFIQMSFDGRGRLVGGNISTYLLEKVRLPKLQPGERNYHIFYQLMNGSSSSQLEEWGFIGSPYDILKQYSYTSQGGEVKYDDLDDVEDFQILQKAFESMEISVDNRLALYRILCGILHFGELKFEPSGNTDCSQLATTSENQFHVGHICRLWGVESSMVEKTLTRATMPSVRNEIIEKRLTPTQAAVAKDSFAKAVYSRLFDWIVNKINHTIVADSSKVAAHIGVLDIFGFEIFAHNSFEQLCINYANEALQQQFNEFVFKAEQQEYQREEIGWSFIQFPDSKDRLDLIEGKPLGILAIIDDFCIIPKPTDERLSSTMGDKLKDSKLFELLIQSRKKGAAELPPLPFLIRHFAGEVIYSFEGFVEKNRDELPKESYLLLQSSSVDLLKALVNESSSLSLAVQSSSGSGLTPSPSTASLSTMSTNSAARFQSVASQFKEQLRGLMSKISATSPHYIRCLKPNDLNVSNIYERSRIVQQLRYCGVLEVCRVSRSGFHVRYKHADFLVRYLNLVTLDTYQQIYAKVGAHFPSNIASIASNDSNAPSIAPSLAPSLANSTANLEILLDSQSDLPNPPSANRFKSKSPWPPTKSTTRSVSPVPVNESPSEKSSPTNKNTKALCLELISIVFDANFAKEKVQIGNTKVFLRKKAHDLLEKMLSLRMRCTVSFQCIYRSYITRKRFLKQKKLIIVLQCAVRSFLSRKLLAFLKAEALFKIKVIELTNRNTANRIIRWYRYRVKERRRLRRICELTYHNNTKRIQIWYRYEKLRQKKEAERLQRILEITQNNNSKRIQLWYRWELARYLREEAIRQRIATITKENNAKRIQLWYRCELARFLREEAIRQRIATITKENNAKRIQLWYRKELNRYLKEEEIRQKIRELTIRNNRKRILVWYRRERDRYLKEEQIRQLIRDLTRKNNCKRIQIWYRREYYRQLKIKAILLKIHQLTISNNAKRVQRWYLIEIERYRREESFRQSIRRLTRYHNGLRIFHWYMRIMKEYHRQRRIVDLTRNNNAKVIQMRYSKYKERCRLLELERQRILMEKALELERLRERETWMERLVVLKNDYQLKSNKQQADIVSDPQSNAIDIEFDPTIEELYELMNIMLTASKIILRNIEGVVTKIRNHVLLNKDNLELFDQSTSEYAYLLRRRLLMAKIVVDYDLIKLLLDGTNEQLLTHPYYNILNPEVNIKRIESNTPLIEVAANQSSVVIESREMEEMTPSDDNMSMIVTGVNETEVVVVPTAIEPIEIQLHPEAIIEETSTEQDLIQSTEMIIATETIVEDTVTVQEEINKFLNENLQDPTFIKVDESVLITNIDASVVVKSDSILDQSVETIFERLGTIPTHQNEEVSITETEERQTSSYSSSMTSSNVIESTEEIIDELDKSYASDAMGIVEDHTDNTDHIDLTTIRKPLSKIFDAYASMEAKETTTEENSLSDLKYNGNASNFNYDDRYQLTDTQTVDVSTSLSPSILRKRQLSLPVETVKTDSSDTFGSPVLSPSNLLKAPSRRMTLNHNLDENLRLKRGESSALDLTPIKYFSSKLQKLYAMQSSLTKIVDDSSIPEIKMDEYSMQMKLISEDYIRVRDEMYINVSDLFTRFKESQSDPKKILILGDAGVGKTTLLSYITHRWGNHEFFHDKFNFIFKVKLHISLSDWRGQYTDEEMKSPLACLIHSSLVQELNEARQRPNSHFSTSIAIDKDELFDILEKCKDTTLLLLDGFDTIASVVSSSNPRREIILTVISEFLRYKYIIVTGRTSCYHEWFQHYFDRIISASGIDDQSIEKYIKKYFNNQISKTGEKLTDLIHSNPSLKRLVKYPLYLTLTCLITATDATLLDKTICRVDFNLERLYREIVLWYGKRYLVEKDGRNIGNFTDDAILAQPVIQTLKEISFQLCYHKEYTISTLVLESIAKKYNTNAKNVFDVGLFKERKLLFTNSSSEAKTQENSITQGKPNGINTKNKGMNEILLDHDLTFNHFIFQEYFASLALKDQLFHVIDKNKAIRFLSLNRHNPSYQLVFQFVILHVMISDHHSNIGNKVSNHKNKDAIVSMLWDSLLCNIDDNLDFDNETRVRYLMTYLQLSRYQNDSRIPHLKKQVQMIDLYVINSIPYYEEQLFSTGYSSLTIAECIRAKISLNHTWNIEIMSALYESSDTDGDIKDLIINQLILLSQSTSKRQFVRNYAEKKLIQYGFDITKHKRSSVLSGAKLLFTGVSESKHEERTTKASISRHVLTREIFEIDSAIKLALEYVNFSSTYFSEEELLGDLYILLQQPNWSMKLLAVNAANVLLKRGSYLLDLHLCRKLVDELKWYLADIDIAKTIQMILQCLIDRVRPDEKSILTHYVIVAYVEQYSIQCQQTYLDESVLPSLPLSEHIDVEYAVSLVEQMQHSCWLFRFLSVYALSKIAIRRWDIFSTEYDLYLDALACACSDMHFQVRSVALCGLSEIISYFEASPDASPKKQGRRLSAFTSPQGLLFSPQNSFKLPVDNGLSGDVKTRIFDILRNATKDVHPNVASIAREIVLELCPTISILPDIIKCFQDGSEASILMGSNALKSMQINSKTIQSFMEGIQSLLSEPKQSIRQIIVNILVDKITAAYLAKYLVYFKIYLNHTNYYLRMSAKSILARLVMNREYAEELKVFMNNLLDDTSETHLSCSIILAKKSLKLLSTHNMASVIAALKPPINSNPMNLVSRKDYVDNMISLLANASNPLFGYLYAGLISYANKHSKEAIKIWNALSKYPLDNSLVIESLCQFALAHDKLAPMIFEVMIDALHSVWNTSSNLLSVFAAALLRIGSAFPSMAIEVVSAYKTLLIHQSVCDKLLSIINSNEITLCDELAEPFSIWFDDESVEPHLRCFAIQLVSSNPNVLSDDITAMISIISRSDYPTSIIKCTVKALVSVASNQENKVISSIVEALIQLLHNNQTSTECLPVILESLESIALNISNQAFVILSELVNDQKYLNLKSLGVCEMIGKIAIAQPYLITADHIKYIEKLLSPDAEPSQRSIGINACYQLSKDSPMVFLTKQSITIIDVLLESLSYTEISKEKISILECLTSSMIHNQKPSSPGHQTSLLTIDYQSRIVRGIHLMLLNYNTLDVRLHAAKSITTLCDDYHKYFNDGMIDELINCLMIDHQPRMEAAEALYSLILLKGQLSTELGTHLNTVLHNKLLQLINSEKNDFYHVQDVVLMFSNVYEDIHEQDLARVHRLLQSSKESSSMDLKLAHCKILLKQSAKAIIAEDITRIKEYIASDNSDLIRIASEVFIAAAEDHSNGVSESLLNSIMELALSAENLYQKYRVLANENFNEYLKGKEILNGKDCSSPATTKTKSMSFSSTASKPTTIAASDTIGNPPTIRNNDSLHSIEFIGRLLQIISQSQGTISINGSDSNHDDNEEIRKSAAEALRLINDQHPELISADYIILVNKILGMPSFDASVDRQASRRMSFRLPPGEQTPIASTETQPVTTALKSKSKSMNVKLIMKAKSDIEVICNELASSRIEIVKKAVKTLTDQPHLVDEYEISKNLDNSLRSSTEIKCIVLDVYISLSKIKSPSITSDTIQRLHTLLVTKGQRDDVRLKVIDVLNAITISKKELITRTVIDTIIQLTGDKYSNVKRSALKSFIIIASNRDDLLYDYIFHQIKSDSEDQGENRRRMPSISIPTNDHPSTDNTMSKTAETKSNDFDTDNKESTTLYVSKYDHVRLALNQYIDIIGGNEYHEYDSMKLIELLQGLLKVYSQFTQSTIHSQSYSVEEISEEQGIGTDILKSIVQVVDYSNHSKKQQKHSIFIQSHNEFIKELSLLLLKALIDRNIVNYDLKSQLTHSLLGLIENYSIHAVDEELLTLLLNQFTIPRPTTTQSPLAAIPATSFEDVGTLSHEVYDSIVSLLVAVMTQCPIYGNSILRHLIECLKAHVNYSSSSIVIKYCGIVLVKLVKHNKQIFLSQTMNLETIIELFHSGISNDIMKIISQIIFEYLISFDTITSDLIKHSSSFVREYVCEAMYRILNHYYQYDEMLDEVSRHISYHYLVSMIGNNDQSMKRKKGYILLCKKIIQKKLSKQTLNMIDTALVDIRKRDGKIPIEEGKSTTDVANPSINGHSLDMNIESNQLYKESLDDSIRIIMEDLGKFVSLSKESELLVRRLFRVVIIISPSLSTNRLQFLISCIHNGHMFSIRKDSSLQREYLVIDGIECDMNIVLTDYKGNYETMLLAINERLKMTRDLAFVQYIDSHRPLFPNRNGYLPIAANDVFAQAISIVSNEPLPHIVNDMMLSFMILSDHRKTIPTRGIVLLEYRNWYGFHHITKISFIFQDNSVSNGNTLISMIDKVTDITTQILHPLAVNNYKMKIFEPMEYTDVSKPRYYGFHALIANELGGQIMNEAKKSSKELMNYLGNRINSSLMTPWSDCLLEKPTNEGLSMVWNDYKIYDLIPLSSEEENHIRRNSERIDSVNNNGSIQDIVSDILTIEGLMYQLLQENIQYQYDIDMIRQSMSSDDSTNSMDSLNAEITSKLQNIERNNNNFTEFQSIYQRFVLYETTFNEVERQLIESQKHVRIDTSVASTPRVRSDTALLSSQGYLNINQLKNDYSQAKESYNSIIKSIEEVVQNIFTNNESIPNGIIREFYDQGLTDAVRDVIYPLIYPNIYSDQLKLMDIIYDTAEKQIFLQIFLIYYNKIKQLIDIIHNDVVIDNIEIEDNIHQDPYKMAFYHHFVQQFMTIYMLCQLVQYMISYSQTNQEDSCISNELWNQLKSLNQVIYIGDLSRYIHIMNTYIPMVGIAMQIFEILISKYDSIDTQVAIIRSYLLYFPSIENTENLAKDIALYFIRCIANNEIDTVILHSADIFLDKLMSILGIALDNYDDIVKLLQQSEQCVFTSKSIPNSPLGSVMDLRRDSRIFDENHSIDMIGQVDKDISMGEVDAGIIACILTCKIISGEISYYTTESSTNLNIFNVLCDQLIDEYGQIDRDTYDISNNIVKYLIEFNKAAEPACSLDDNFTVMPIFVDELTYILASKSIQLQLREIDPDMYQSVNNPMFNSDMQLIVSEMCYNLEKAYIFSKVEIGEEIKFHLHDNLGGILKGKIVHEMRKIISNVLKLYKSGELAKIYMTVGQNEMFTTDDIDILPEEE